MEGRALLRVVARFGIAAAVFAHAAATQQETAAQVFSCTGRFVDENGDGVAGVAMRVVDWQAFVDTRELIASPRATSADDGTFSIDYELVKGGAYLVFAAAGRQAGRVSIDQVPGFALAPIVLPPGSQVTGRVRDVDGRPLAGVHVTIEDGCPQIFVHAIGRMFACATSDEKGIFTVPCTAQAGLRLIAHRDGYLAEQRLCARDSALDLTLVKAEMVHGVLLGTDDRPAAGISVSIQTSGTFEHPARSATTAADGTFRLPAPPRHVPYQLTAYSADLRVIGEWLRGGQEHVELHLQPWPGDEPFELRVRARDAQGNDIGAFTIARLSYFDDNLQATLSNRMDAPLPFVGEATIRGSRRYWQGLLVEADGHAFAAVQLPNDTTQPLVVELGPEAVITGTAVDEHGEPAAGVFVRALPKGPMSGYGGALWKWWPKTDADGRFRIAGLQPGSYGVQLHAPDRAATRPVFVEATAEQPATVDLQLPAPIVASLDVRGEVPRGPSPLLFVGMAVYTDFAEGWFRHALPRLAPLAIPKAGRYTLGPLDTDRTTLHLFTPSCTRIGAGCELLTQNLEVEAAPLPLDLPSLQRVQIDGRVTPSGAIPLDRVAVHATPAIEHDWNPRAPRSCIAGVCGNGQFRLDVPGGKYWLQLADLQTGLVFHTEPTIVELKSGQLVLRPDAHLLTIVCDSGKESSAANVSSIVVEFPEDPARQAPRFLNERRADEANIPWPAGVSEQTWIVPAGSMELTATHWQVQQDGTSNRVVSDSAELTIEQDHTRVVLNAPPAPTEQTTRDK